MPDYDPNDDGDESPDGEGNDFRAFDVNVGGGGLRDLLDGLLDGDRSSPSYRDHLFDAAPGPRREDGERTSGTDDRDAFRVDARRTDGALAVTADLPGVDVDDLAVGVGSESNDLVVRVRGETVERVPLPWEAVVATRKRFRNGVLEVRLRPATDPPER